MAHVHFSQHPALPCHLLLPSRRLLPKFDSIDIYSVYTQRVLGSTYEGEQAVFFLLSLGHLVEYHTLLLG